MNNIDDLNNRSGDLFEFTDTRSTAVTFTFDPPLDKSITVNEGATFDLPIGMEIQEIINYSQTNVAVSIDISNAPGSSVDWGTLPSYVSSNENTPEIFQITGLRSGADWNNIMPNVDITLNSSFNGSLTIPVTVSYTDGDGVSQSKSYDVNATVLQVLSLTQVSAIHYYTHNTEQVISSVPQIQDTGVGYTWTVTVESLRPEVLDEITYTGSDATFSWNSSTKVATFTGTKAGVNTALSGMKVKVLQNTFWDFDLEFNSSNDNNAETDVSVVSCKTNDQSVMKKSVSDTYASPNTVVETITGGPRITATSGLFLTTIESYDPNDVDSFNASSISITGNIVEQVETINGYSYTWTGSGATDHPTGLGSALTRDLVTASGYTVPMFPTFYAVNAGAGVQIFNDNNTVLMTHDGFRTSVFEKSGGSWSAVAVLQHPNEIYSDTVDSNISGFVSEPLAQMSKDGSTIVITGNQADTNGDLYYSKLFVNKKVNGVWTKTHEIDNPLANIGTTFFGASERIDELAISSTGNYIIVRTKSFSNNIRTNDFFVAAYDSGTNTWSTRTVNLPSDWSDYSGTTDYNNQIKISTNGSRICLLSSSKSTAPTTASENPFCYVATWNSSQNAYTQTQRLLYETNSVRNIAIGAISITPDGNKMLLTNSVSGTPNQFKKYDFSSNSYTLKKTFNYTTTGTPQISPDGQTIVTGTPSFTWNGTDFDQVSNIIVHKFESTSGSGDVWQSTTIANTLTPPGNAATGYDYRADLHGLHNMNLSNNYATFLFGNTDPDAKTRDFFFLVVEWDDLGRFVDNTGTPTLTVFGNQTDHNTLLWNFDMLVNNGLTTPVELIYTTEHYKTDGTLVVSSRNHFINPV